MTPLEQLDAAKGGAFVVNVRGKAIELTPPTEMPFQQVLGILQAEHHTDTPDCSVRQRAMIFEAWAARYDLPSFTDAQRLAYLADHYTEALTSDFQRFLQLDFGACWRGRRWRTMLAYIDRLPGHSWYSAAVSADEEHAEMLAKALEERAAARTGDEEEIPDGPSWVTWTPEVAAITTLTDAVNRLSYYTLASNSEKPPPAPTPMPRPFSPLEAAMKRTKLQRRQAKHDALVARMLPHKAKPQP